MLSAGRRTRLTSRTRVATALAHQQPDRPPVFATYVPEVERRLRDERAIHEGDLGVALGNDLVKACVGLETSFNGEPEPEYEDAWSIRWRYVRNAFGKFTEISVHPLAGDRATLDRFEIPDPEEDTQYDSFRRAKAQYGGERWIIGSCQISVFEAAWYLRGFDQLFVDMMTARDYVHALMDKVMRFPLVAGRKFAEMGADMVWFGDDVSMQRGMMMSVAMWREFLRPRYERLFAEVKRVNPAVKTAYHCCGDCAAILDDLIDIGLDVLNPVQPLAIDPFAIKKRYGARLALFGGLCVQRVLPRGTPDEVRQSVAHLKSECGRGGGYILAPAHHIQADTPSANIEAFYDAALAEPAG
ncbi:MAG: uroporphyrinogen decarboxylase family protein [Bacteroidales bacterium]